MKTSFSSTKGTKFPRRRPVSEETLRNLIESWQTRSNFFKGFPSSGPSQWKLAKNGFIYNRSGDEVICVECRLQVKDLTTARQVSAAHLKLSPECPQANSDWDDDLLESSDSSESDTESSSDSSPSSSSSESQSESSESDD